MNPEYIDAKSILSPLKSGPDKYFGIAYSMNIYRGCQHGCIYCDTRSKVYNIGNLSHIRIKKNALGLLEQQLKKIKQKNTIGTGSMNDPYMPIEKNHKLIQSALKIIEKYKFPVHIITKSNMVIRDADIIKQLNDIYSSVTFTITTADDSLSKKIEPGAPVSSERLQAMRFLSDMGIYTGAVISPVLPYLTDTTKNIISIINKVADAGGKYIIAFMGLTQREGQREYFYSKLQELFPGMESRYHQLYHNNYNCSVPNAERLYDVYNSYCLSNKLDTRMKFYQPPEESSQLRLFE